MKNFYDWKERLKIKQNGGKFFLSYKQGIIFVGGTNEDCQYVLDNLLISNTKINNFEIPKSVINYLNTFKNSVDLKIALCKRYGLDISRVFYKNCRDDIDGLKYLDVLDARFKDAPVDFTNRMINNQLQNFVVHLDNFDENYVKYAEFFFLKSTIISFKKEKYNVNCDVYYINNQKLVSYENF